LWSVQGEEGDVVVVHGFAVEIRVAEVGVDPNVLDVHGGSVARVKFGPAERRCQRLWQEDGDLDAVRRGDHSIRRASAGLP
jgi:hypothetical protein